MPHNIDPSSVAANQQVPPPPTGTPDTVPITKQRAVGIAILWAVVGAVASGSGALLGAVVGVWNASPCTGLLCGLEDMLFAALFGWISGSLLAVGAATTYGSLSGLTATSRAMSAVLGIIALPVVLILMVAI